MTSAARANTASDGQGHMYGDLEDLRNKVSRWSTSTRSRSQRTTTLPEKVAAGGLGFDVKNRRLLAMCQKPGKQE